MLRRFFNIRKTGNYIKTQKGVMLIKLLAIFSLILAFISSSFSFIHSKDYQYPYAAQPQNSLLNKLPDNLSNNESLLIDMTVLFAAYKDYIKDIDIVNEKKLFIVMRNNARILYDDGKEKTFEEKLDNPDLKDMLSQLYNLNIDKFKKDYDPGRFRVNTFFSAIYGSTPEEVKKNLVPVKFCGTMVFFNSKNGGAEALEKVGLSLISLIKKKPELRKYIFPLGGTFSWRTIAKTQRMSPHSWGIATDLNPKYGAYWQWGSLNKEAYILRLRKEYPAEIVQIFYDHGFIWGGSWSHYDLMHFEYRPELVLKARIVNGDIGDRYKLN